MHSPSAPLFLSRFSRRTGANLTGARAAFWLVCAWLTSAPLAAWADDSPEYHRDVQPILREFCLGCHNDQTLEGELSMETFRQLMQGGSEGAPITPGQAQESLLIRLLTGKATPRMPPRREPKPSSEQIAVLTAWIDAGAAGPAPDEDLSMLAALAVPKIEPKPGLPLAITAAEYSTDGALLALGQYQRVEIFEDEQRQRVIDHLPGKVTAIHFSPDSTSIITGSGISGLSGQAAIWRTATGELVRAFSGQHSDLLYDAELSPDGRLLATAGYDRQIVLWEVESGKVVRALTGHNGAVFDLAFSPNGTILASASADATVKLWRVADGERLDTLNQPQAEQYSVLFSPDGQSVAAAGADNRIRLWRLISHQEPAINPLLISRFGHEAEIVRIGLSKDAAWLVSSSADRSVKLWSWPDLLQVSAFEDQPDVGAALAFRPGAFTVGRLDGTWETWTLDQAAPPASTNLPAQAAVRSPLAQVDAIAKVQENEPNSAPEQAQLVPWAVEINGTIASAGDVDLFQFHSPAGEEWTLAVNAARSKSKLDSRLEVLHVDGTPVERVVLQAVRDSWFTFRGKDSATSGDFRLQNWREMELNEYLYANGEVVKLWLYPNGPDSGFKVYPGFGKRHTFFGTTALAHALGEPCYIVQPFSPGNQPIPNGLPLFRINYVNDDEPQQRWGQDSQLLFTAPEAGDYLVRLSDIRGFGGREYHYALTLRPRQPDFTMTLEGKDPTVSPGSGREFILKVDRHEGFSGPIRVDVAGLPEGFATRPVVIEPDQDMAIGVIYAAAEANPPAEQNAKGSTLIATATIRGKTVEREVGSLGEIKLGGPPKLTLEILPDGDSGQVREDGTLEFFLEPGKTITALVRATRVDFDQRIEFGTDDSGRNLPHGVYIDNIGLNGLLIVEGQSERQFFITAASWVPETRRAFHLRATADGGQASPVAILHVLRPNTVVSR